MAIAYFPIAIPGEMFYSICACLQERMRYPMSRTFFQNLFNTISIRPLADLPTHLDTFISNVRPEFNLDSEGIINDATLLPYYAAFMSIEQVQNIVRAMHEGTRNGVYPRTVTINRPVQLPDYFQHCPCCSEQDLEEHGRYCWRSLHQIPGVEVCPDHKVWLENTAAQMPNAKPKDHYRFISANEVIVPKSAHPLDPTNSAHRLLIAIANDAEWLLRHGRQVTDIEALRERYMMLMVERGLAFGRRVKLHKVENEFIHYCPDELLSRWGCSLDAKQNWLIRLAARTTEKLYSPLFHLLFIHFLGHTAETFFSLPTRREPFGAGPWPCLNPVCPNYKKFTIKICRVEIKPRSRLLPHGIFNCDCGFTYSRTGPDKSVEDIWSFERVLVYGPVWEAELRRLWESPDISLGEIAISLGVMRDTAKRHAARLKLSFNLSFRKLEMPSSLLSAYYPEQQILFQKTLLEKQETWLKALEANPGLTLSTLSDELRLVHHWLYINNNIWWTKHKLVSDYTDKAKLQVDRQVRDFLFLTNLKPVVDALLDESFKPTRISLSNLRNGLRKNGQYASLTRYHLRNLPQTDAYLSTVLETSEQFMLRRIKWVENCYRSERISPTYWEFLKRASLTRESAERLPIRQAIEAALQRLETM